MRCEIARRASDVLAEGAAAPDLDAIAVGKRIRDRVEYSIHRGLRIALIETRIGSHHAFNEF